MERDQADAIVKAILEPATREREQAKRKRELMGRQMAHRRKVAWVALFGCAVGWVVGYLTDYRIAQCVLWGGLAGAACGWLVAGWRTLRQRMM